MSERKPHLLHVSLDSLSNCGVSYSIVCPHDDLGADRPCAILNACECADLGKCECVVPVRPRSSEPAHVFLQGERQYADPDSPEAVEWTEFWKAVQEDDERHHADHWKPQDKCWIVHVLADSDYEGSWETKGFEDEAISGPVKVDWENVGSVDDSFLVLSPWVDEGMLPHSPFGI